MGPPPGPPRKSDSGNAIAIVAVIAAVLFCCCLPVGLFVIGPFGGTLLFMSQVDNLVAGTTVPTGPPAPLGTEVVVDGWGVTVVTAEPDATARLTAEDPIYRPGTGRRPLLVTVTLRNGNAAPAAVQSDVRVGLVPRGRTLPLSPSVRLKNEGDIDRSIPPGGTATGRYLFEVDSSVTVADLSVEPSVSVSNTGRRLLALQ
jgi:hypothetical protein